MFRGGELVSTEVDEAEVACRGPLASLNWRKTIKCQLWIGSSCL